MNALVRWAMVLCVCLAMIGCGDGGAPPDANLVDPNTPAGAGASETPEATPPGT